MAPQESDQTRQALQSGRQPGDQSVRPHAGQAGVQEGEPGNRRMKGAAQPGSSQGANRTAGGGQAQGDRVKERGKASHGQIGKEAIPIYVDGVQKGEISGQKLAEQLQEVTVNLRRGARGGWPVAEAFNLAGIRQAGKATFVDRKGTSKSVAWSELTAKEPIYVLSYNQGGQLLLLKGEEAKEDSKTGQKNRGRRNRGDGQKPTGEVAVQDIVKIELTRS
jgi:hypothetical protein